MIGRLDMLATTISKNSKVFNFKIKKSQTHCRKKPYIPNMILSRKQHNRHTDGKKMIE